MMKRFHFWRQWLFYSSILFAFAGILFAIYGDNPLFVFYNKALANIFWNTENIPSGTQPFRAFIWAPLGGTIACCYILLACIARYPFRRKEKWSWYAIVIAFSIWILIDTAACIYYRVYFQAYMINAFSFLVKALPLIFTYRDFFRSG
jgi:hypothetical protein